MLQLSPRIGVLAATLIALVLAVAGCGAEPGKVVATGVRCGGRPNICHPWIKTRTKDGVTTGGTVGWKTYYRCSKGELYPACKEGKKGGRTS